MFKNLLSIVVVEHCNDSHSAKQEVDAEVDLLVRETFKTGMQDRIVTIGPFVTQAEGGHFDGRGFSYQRKGGGFATYKFTKPDEARKLYESIAQ